LSDSKLHVAGCPLCDIFAKKDIKTKLYWPESIDEVENSEFVIVDCLTCKIPMVVYTDHTTTLSREAWGRILYRCRKLFGSSITLRIKRIRIKDHWHAHIQNIEK